MKVFLSYAHADQSFVEQLDANLAKNNIDAWYDRKRSSGLRAGETWQGRLQLELSTSPAVCVVLSPESTRAGCFVENEYLFALDQQLKVVPLVYRKCEIPLALYKLQRVYFTGQPFGSALAELLAALAQPRSVPQHVPQAVDKVELRRQILGAFDRERLEILCADMNSRFEKEGSEIRVSPEIVGGRGLEAVVLNLIEYLDRRGLLSYLVDAVRTS